jgi:uncharacterized membrane protein YkvA (DUF1232 family)
MRVDIGRETVVAAGVVVVLYGAFVLVLILRGRRADARAVAGFVPDCAVALRGLLRDERVGRGRKLLLLVLVAYLVSPIDLVPDFIPVAGQLDDAILVIVILRRVLAGSAVTLRDHWRGPAGSLEVLERFIGRPRHDYSKDSNLSPPGP